MPTWVTALNAVAAREGVDLAAVGLAWARVAPAVTIVPAFGLRALPAPARALLGLSLAVVIAPAVIASVAGGAGAVSAAGGAGAGGAGGQLVASSYATQAIPWIVRAAVECMRGLPVAIAAAVPLWAATMAGGVADALRGSQDAPSVPVVEGRATPLGAPISILASAIFLASGGPARVAMALVAPAAAGNPFVAAANDLAQGTAMAVALGAPLLAAAVVIEIAGALVARAAAPAQVHALLAPLRALGVLTVLALVFSRLAAALSSAVTAAVR